MNIQPIHFIVTHAGSFHADEVMAIALLERFYLLRPTQMSEAETDTHNAWLKGEIQPQGRPYFYHDGVEEARLPVMIIRSRDQQFLEKAKKHSAVFTIDVGGVFNASQLNFDHHQESMTQGWEDGTPYSSTGLIWQWLKQKGHLKTLPASVQKELEDKLIKPLDAHDNGREKLALSSFIASFNRKSSDGLLQGQQFSKAKEVLGEAFDNLRYTLELQFEAEKIVKEAWKRAKRENKLFLQLPRDVDYRDCEGLARDISNNEAQMVILPGQGNRYTIKSISFENSFKSKCPCPAEWRGKMHFQVLKDQNPVKVHFAHKSGFMCVIEGTRQDAERVAQHIIDHNQLQLKIQKTSTFRP